MNTQSFSIKTISPDGEGFVKTATAAPDFESTVLEGIPDNYNGPSVVKKDYVFETIVAIAGKATYIIITPTAGVSYFTPVVPPDTGVPLVDADSLQAHYFPDAAEMFNGITEEKQVSNSDQLSKGRLMALSAELNCVNNSFNQYGTISAWKTPLARTTAAIDQPGFDVTDNVQLTGARGIVKVALDSQAYVEPVRRGVYSVSMNREENFQFFPVLDDLNKLSTTPARFENTERLYFTGCAPVFDNGFDTIVFRIDVPPGTTNQSFVLKIWKVWEYQPTFNSLLYNFSHLSPDVDHSALALYREMCRHLPMAVPDKDNPDFWNLILQAVDQASSLLSGLPGPVGTVASGVHSVSHLLNTNRRRKMKAPKPAIRTNPRPKAKGARQPRNQKRTPKRPLQRKR
jgi:hypothetical protein